MFNRNNRAIDRNQAFQMNNNKNKGNEATESLDQIFAIASTSNSKRHSNRIRQQQQQQHETAKGVPIKIPSIPQSLSKRRGRASFNNNKSMNGKRRAPGPSEEEDDFQDQQPNLSKSKLDLRPSKKGKNNKAKNNKDKHEKEDAKVPELVIRSSKRKVNGAPSTLADKKKRQEDQRRKQEEIESLSFSSNLDVDDFLDDADNGKILKAKKK